MKFFYLLFLSAIISFNAYAQYGCTDPQATNYNAGAIINDGSCVYASTNLPLTTKASMSTPLLDETSGIEFLENKLWTHNDSGNDNKIFRIDTVSGTVFQTVTISNATNVDWEDITSSNNDLFVGDFGNNFGNRTNLRIYKINKNLLTDTVTAVNAEIINFSFSDQTTFTSALNNNNYDCEAMIFYNDSLHLFSKDWVDKQCRHYVLPATAGTYIAQVRETFNAGFLITGAAIQNGGVIALCGYDNTGLAPVSLWMLYDFHGGLFFNGNKRKFNLSNALSNGQVEGIDFKNDAYGYISNERFTQSIFNVAPKLKSFDLKPYLPASFVTPRPVANFTSDIESVCKNSTVAFADQSSNSPSSWKWIFPGGDPSSSTLQNPVVKYSQAGTYDVELIVINAGGSDTLIKTQNITVNNLPVANIIAAGATNFCNGGSTTLNANTGAGYAYKWKKDGAFINGATASAYMATVGGEYKAVETNASGCSKVSNSIVLTGPPVSKVYPGSSLAFCNGDSVVLNGSPSGPGYTYQWIKSKTNIPGATGGIYTAKIAGNYKVNVTNIFGCSVTSAKKTVAINCRMENEFSDQVVKVYPNPSNNSFRIESLSPGTEIMVSLSDITGRVLENRELSNPDGLILGERLSPGIYFITVTHQDKKQLMRIIKI